jgi:hypothetical protein
MLAISPLRELSLSLSHVQKRLNVLAGSVLLLQRADLDLYLKDSEGLTAFDLYNTTVEGTRPSFHHGDVYIGQLYTWSTNKSIISPPHT